MRQRIRLLWVALAVAGVVELSCSYLLFRHYASAGVAFQPAGSSAYQWIGLAVRRITKGPQKPDIRSEPAPMFGLDPSLGYHLNPGRYRITETLAHFEHAYDLSVDASGRRVVSYSQVHAAQRLYLTGDSSFFGLGLNDEETMGWLLQGRLPTVEVVNLTLTGYSTIHALLQMRDRLHEIDSNDISVFVYREQIPSANVLSGEILESLKDGYEWHLGNPSDMEDVAVPYGRVGTNNELGIHRFPLSCARNRNPSPDCVHWQATRAEALQVTRMAFDEILRIVPGHVVIAILSGRDDDPMIAHFRARGALIADLRTPPDGPDSNDVIPTDMHGGAFMEHDQFDKLLDFLQRERLVQGASGP